MEIPLHANVICADGACGESAYVIVDPRTETVTHLVVRENGLSAEEYLVPIDTVIETSAGRILVRCTRAEMGEMTPFEREEYIPGTSSFLTYPAEGYLTWPAVAPEAPLPLEVRQNPPGTLPIERGARVKATDGEIGQVDELLIDPVTNRVTHIILREGAFWDKKDVTIPVDQVERIDEDGVYLKVDKKTVAELPTRPVS
jgi:uncharacterized protein YrrD